ncbi:1-(5-phosphoribosyl)-5-[(5-phosphoribosylamino)methylideneamino]imidazole-4-carboxamide isomerase [Chromatiales bacterium (ex Bugula neritina AB1)]|nr:1-(5-phosphoribosyl)-5-[(5-phosphoribosylamino)methylideneamino]imidazole-4-carboxamide isomerase [Chromatiales bacterium (ex Bugula neritina AB1)]
MQLIPAIDLKDGQCVRLKQGRMEDDTVFSDDVVATAARWVDAGSDRLHMVDLNGAFAGAPKNAAAVHEVCKAFPGLDVQIGGGVRNEEIAGRYLSAGVRWVIIGTQAVVEPDFVGRLCREWPGQVMVGLDARDGKVAVNGWAEDSGLDAAELAKSFEGDGISGIVYTDISRDGMMQGFNSEATAALAESISIPVYASGGVSDYKDVEGLCEIADHGVAGAIVGRALYEGTIDFAEAQRRIASLLGTGLPHAG